MDYVAADSGSNCDDLSLYCEHGSERDILSAQDEKPCPTTLTLRAEDRTPLINPRPDNLPGHHTPEHRQVDRRLGSPPQIQEEINPRRLHQPQNVTYPDYRPVTRDQLVMEVKKIYADLREVEKKCINLDEVLEKQYESAQPSNLGREEWQALIKVHQTLLHEHHDFFQASQHPLAGQELRQLAEETRMPARMWKHGIYSFLELLRRRLPESSEPMLTFFYRAYAMVGVLYETIPAFRNTWMECLGDLTRYRMTIEIEGILGREDWIRISRSWYSKTANKTPSVGRLYHHLALLAREDATQQLYYYCRSLTCVERFMATQTSLLTLLEPFLSLVPTSSSLLPMNASFIRAHGILFQGTSLDLFQETSSDYLGRMHSELGLKTAKWKDQGVWIAVTNIASLFNYGSETSTLRQIYDYQARLRNTKSPTGINGNSTSASGQAQLTTTQLATAPQDLDSDSQSTFAYACRLTFTTLGLVLQRNRDENVLPHVHVMLSFLLSLTDIPCDCTFILDKVPWQGLALFLTKLPQPENSDLFAENSPFPHRDQQPLPEDYDIRGQVWSQWYYPKGWFDSLYDGEERAQELLFTTKLRTERILWLAIRLASALHGGRIRYDSLSKHWSAV